MSFVGLCLDMAYSATNSCFVDAEKLLCSILPINEYIPSALVRQGMVPCSPILPSVAVTIDALELYHTSHLRCPHLSIQAFVKTLSDLHGVSTAHIYALTIY